jgi:hypothetical protein
VGSVILIFITFKPVIKTIKNNFKIYQAHVYNCNMSAGPTHVEIRLEEPKPSFWKRILCCCCHRKSKRLDMKRLEEPDANAQEQETNAPNEDQTKAQDEEMKVLTLTEEPTEQDEEANPIKEQEDANVVIVEVVEVVESNVVEEPKEQDEVKVEADKAIEEQDEVKAKADKAIEEPKAEEPKAEEPKAEEPKAEEPKAEEPKAEEPKADEKEEPTNAKKRTASFYKNKKKNKNQKIQTNMISEASSSEALSKSTLSESSSSEAPLSPEYVVVSPQKPQ